MQFLSSTQQPATRSEAKKSQSLQDVLSKRVVQLEAKLTQQSLEKDTMAEVVVVTVHTCGAMVLHVSCTQKTSKSLNVALGHGNSMHKQEVDLILPVFLVISLVNSIADCMTCLFCVRHQELEKLRPLAAATEEVEQRASSAEELLRGRGYGVWGGRAVKALGSIGFRCPKPKTRKKALWRLDWYLVSDTRCFEGIMLTWHQNIKSQMQKFPAAFRLTELQPPSAWCWDVFSCFDLV